MTNGAILFDLDGTLIDSGHDLAFALNQVLAQQKQPIKSYDKIRPVVSDGVQGLLCCGFGDNIIRAPEYVYLSEQLLLAYEATQYQQSQLFSGIEKLLHEIMQHRIPWGIVTNKATHFTHAIIERIALLQQAAIIICGDTYETKKPDPLPLLKAAQRLGQKPSDCFYIGDSWKDVTAANQANMVSVFVEYGYGSQTSAKITVSDTTALFKIIESKFFS